MDWQVFIIPTIVACLLHEAGHAYQSWRETGKPIRTFGIGLPFWPMVRFKIGELDCFISLWLVAMVVSQEPLPIMQKTDSLKTRFAQWLDTLSDSAFLSKSPKERFRVAMAGPMVNILLALLVPMLILGFQNGVLLMMAALDPNLIANVAQGTLGGFPNAEMVEIAFAWLIINLVLGLFNLLPIPPLDGGHVALAALDHFFPVAGVAKSRRVWWANIFSLVGLALMLVLPVLILIKV